MRLDKIVSLGYGTQASNVTKNIAKSSFDIKEKSRRNSSQSDSYTPSKSAVKAKNLDEVRQRIKDGYYNSEEVNKDLADMFSNAFDSL